MSVYAGEYHIIYYKIRYDVKNIECMKNTFIF